MSKELPLALVSRGERLEQSLIRVASGCYPDGHRHRIADLRAQSAAGVLKSVMSAPVRNPVQVSQASRIGVGLLMSDF
jgi:hypothetical protein